MQAYTWEATYEFQVPPYTRDRTIQDIQSSEILVDLYWNTRRVWLVDARVQCQGSSGRWLTYASTTADHHFAVARTTVFSDDCRLNMTFVNDVDDRYKNAPQRAAVRVNVSSTTGGQLRLTKTRNPLGAQSYIDVSQTDRRQVLLDRVAAREAALDR